MKSTTMKNPFSKLSREKKSSRNYIQLNRDPSSYDRRGNRSSGDEPMTSGQEQYLQQLTEEAGETAERNLSKTEASKRIDELKMEGED